MKIDFGSLESPLWQRKSLWLKKIDCVLASWKTHNISIVIAKLLRHLKSMLRFGALFMMSNIWFLMSVYHFIESSFDSYMAVVIFASMHVRVTFSCNVSVQVKEHQVVKIDSVSPATVCIIIRSIFGCVKCQNLLFGYWDVTFQNSMLSNVITKLQLEQYFDHYIHYLSKMRCLAVLGGCWRNYHFHTAQ